MSNSTHFWLIRHGETQWNAEKRLQGWRDIPLSSVGIKQAEVLGEYLRVETFDPPIDLVVSSDLARAHDTACIATGHLGFPILACAELRERSYGIYEGQAWAALDGLKAKNRLNLRDPDQDIDQGESLRTFQMRILAAFEDLARRYKGRNILVFSHGGVIDVVWRKVSNLAVDAPRPHPILNTSINNFSIDENGHWALKAWGCTSHLEKTTLDDII